MGDGTNPGAQARPIPERRSRVHLSGWLSFLVVFVLTGIVLSALWYLGEWFVAKPYYEYKQLGPLPTSPIPSDTQVYVEYPRRISQDDQGIEHRKRIIVGVTKVKPGPEEAVHLAVVAQSGHVRFLNKEGHDASGLLVITSTYGITNVDFLFVEHSNIRSRDTVNIIIRILPPTGALSKPELVPNSSFAIERESLVQTTIRRLVSVIPWQTFLITLLALALAPLRGLWTRTRKLTDLHTKMQRAWDEWQIDQIRTLYHEYRLLRIRFLGIEVAHHKEIDSLYRHAEARFHFQQARIAQQQKDNRSADELEKVALNYDPVYERVQPLYEEVLKLEKVHPARSQRLTRLEEELDEKRLELSKKRNQKAKALEEGHSNIDKTKQELQEERRKKALLLLNIRQALRGTSRKQIQISSERIRELKREYQEQRWLHQNLKLEKDEEIKALEEEIAEKDSGYKTINKKLWWLASPPSQKTIQVLIRLAADREKTQSEVRRRIIGVLGHTQPQEAGAAVKNAFQGIYGLSAQAQAAWMLANRPRIEEAKVREASPEVVERWLKTILSPRRNGASGASMAEDDTRLEQITLVNYIPFEATAAEDDTHLESHFMEHSAYRYLRDFDSRTVALFAKEGRGKTSCRRIYKKHLEDKDRLVLEYTDFGQLIQETAQISVEDHIQCILNQASGILGIDSKLLSSPGTTWQDQINRLLKLASHRGFPSVHVLVDNVNGCAEAQADPKVSESLLRHFVGDFNLLETPRLCFTLFLPMNLKRSLSTYGGFTSGRVMSVDIDWNRESLAELLRKRLETAFTTRIGPEGVPSRISSLADFVAVDLKTNFKVEIDRLVIQRAQGSPRQLIKTANMLFQHRARIWNDGGKKPEDLYITLSDWASLLEQLLEHNEVM